jgi:hypothetical protein
VHAILRRLESGERCWCAECALRGLGAALLGVCATASWWLHRTINQPASHVPGTFDLAVAALGVTALGLGLAFTFEGPGLFRLIPAPGHHHFTP